MTIQHLKSGRPAADRAEDDAKVRASVEAILKDIEIRDNATVRDLAQKFVGFTAPSFRLTESEIEAAMQHVSTREMEEIRFALPQVCRLADGGWTAE